MELVTGRSGEAAHHITAGSAASTGYFWGECLYP